MGNGHPVAAAITRSEIVDRFAEATDWFSTFAGNPVSSAAALAVLDVLDDERILQRVRAAGELARAGLREVTKGNPFVGEVRGIGLINTVELVRDLETKSPDANLTRRIVDGMRQRGVLIGTCGKDASCLKIRPPLAFTPAEIPLLLSTFEQAQSQATR